MDEDAINPMMRDSEFQPPFVPTQYLGSLEVIEEEEGTVIGSRDTQPVIREDQREALPSIIEFDEEAK